MRHGFAYIRLQIWLALLALLTGSSFFFVQHILRQNLYLSGQLKEAALIQQVLDKMSEDIKQAEAVDAYPDRVRISLGGTEYTYLLNNQRLVRRKDAYLYLTPANLPLRELSINWRNGLLEIILYGEKQVWLRMVRM